MKSYFSAARAVCIPACASALLLSAGCTGTQVKQSAEETASVKSAAAAPLPQLICEQNDLGAVSSRAAVLAAATAYGKAYELMKQNAQCAASATGFDYAAFARYALMTGNYAEAVKYAQQAPPTASTGQKFPLEGVQTDDGRFIMNSVLPEAAALGVQKEDEIVSVGGKPVKDMTLEDLRKAAGEGGAELEISRAGTPSPVKITLPSSAPQSSGGNGVYALALYFSGESRKAALAAKKALAANPADADAATALGLVKTDADETKTALKLLPGDGGLGTLARAYAWALSGKDYPAVTTYADADVALTRLAYPPVLELKGRVAKLIAGARRQSEEEVQQLEEKKNYRGELLTLAFLSRMPGAPSEEAAARAAMFEFANKWPAAAQLAKKPSALAAAAEEAALKGDFKSAAAAYRSALGIAPWSGKLHCALSDALANSGDETRAGIYSKLCAESGYVPPAAAPVPSAQPQPSAPETRPEPPTAAPAEPPPALPAEPAPAPKSEPAEKAMPQQETAPAQKASEALPSFDKLMEPAQDTQQAEPAAGQK